MEAGRTQLTTQYDTIEQRRMEEPKCWKCGGTRFIRYGGKDNDADIRLAVCYGCGRMYRLTEPYLRLIFESPNAEAEDFLEYVRVIRRSIRMKLLFWIGDLIDMSRFYFHVPSSPFPGWYLRLVVSVMWSLFHKEPNSKAGHVADGGRT